MFIKSYCKQKNKNFVISFLGSHMQALPAETLKKEKWAIKFPKGAKRTDEFFVGFVNKNIKNINIYAIINIMVVNIIIFNKIINSCSIRSKKWC